MATTAQIAAIVHATARHRHVFLATDGRHRGQGGLVDDMKRQVQCCVVVPGSNRSNSLNPNPRP